MKKRYHSIHRGIRILTKSIATRLKRGFHRDIFTKNASQERSIYYAEMEGHGLLKASGLYNMRRKIDRRLDSEKNKNLKKAKKK